MAIKKKITFEGLTYKLQNKERVAAQASVDADFSSIPTSDPGVAGALWVSGSTQGADSSKYLAVSQG